jgi:diadenosine tetraphosphate (Ap4A) HIT family hydrolase
MAQSWNPSAPLSSDPPGESGINATIRTFGYPDSAVAEYEHWVVLLRPQQATLGALVLAARSAATRFGDLSGPAFAELQRVIAEIEATLAACFRNDKINYLMLMMVDPHVHFHVLPRYREAQQFEGATFEDPGWPKPPVLSHATEIDPRIRVMLRDRLRNNWHRQARTGS